MLMNGKVNLYKFVEQLYMMDTAEDWLYFVDRSTGEIITLERQYLSMAEEEEVPVLPLAPWEKEQLEQANAVLNRWEDMLHFPDRRELDEYSMMEEFIENYPEAHIRDCLSTDISGRGAFRRFKDTLARFGVAEQWHAFHDAQMLEFAQNWCKENKIPYDMEPASCKN